MTNTCNTYGACRCDYDTPAEFALAAALAQHAWLFTWLFITFMIFFTYVVLIIYGVYNNHSIANARVTYASGQSILTTNEQLSALPQPTLSMRNI